MLPTRIVIVDDDEIFRQELHRLFDEHQEFSIVGEASNAVEAIEVVQCVALDILLLNPHIGNMTGLSVLQKLRRLANFRTILLGPDIQREDEISAILSGASGIFRKSAPAETLVNSIRSVLDGQIWAKRDLLRDLLAITRNSGNSIDNRVTQIRLTARELDIICAVAQGLANKEISELLGISPFTVKHYLTRIFNKVFVNSRVELALFATRNGLAANKAQGVQHGHSKD